MPLVMFSRRRIGTSRHCGYCGSHCPRVSSIDRRCSASSCSSSTEVNALVLLPICQTLSGRTGTEPPKVVVPALTSMVDPATGQVHAQAGGREVLRRAAGLQIGVEVGAQLRGDSACASARGRRTG